jgi:hypothetical protein
MNIKKTIQKAQQMLDKLPNGKKKSKLLEKHGFKTEVYRGDIK